MGEKREKRYPLALILTLLLPGKMAGEQKISGVVDWIKEREGWLRVALNWPKRFPVNSTYSEALAGCDGKEVAQRIAQVILWAIENRLHYRRDVTLGEDASQLRRKNAPQTLAALNGAILALMNWLNVKNFAKKMRHFCAQPQ